MTRARILLVDDEAPMLRGLERTLGGDYELRSAGDARAALAACDDFEPDLAILDVRLPGQDGFAVLAALRERHPGVDAIFITGEVHQVDAQLIRAIRERAFYFVQKPFDREVLLTLVDRCLALRKASAANRRHVARLERELADARSFQLGLLPERSVTRGPLRLEADYVPCSELGGDFFDHARLPDGGLALLVADVSGHGVSAAMLTALVKSAFHDAGDDAHAPLAVVARVVGSLRSFDEARFVTLFVGRLTADGDLEYVNAGHPAPLLGRPGASPRLLRATGALISPAFPDLEWGLARARLEPGERLLAYTDGIVEARSVHGELFGDERLLRQFTIPNVGICGRVRAAVTEHVGGRPLDDDLTLLCVDRDA